MKFFRVLIYKQGVRLIFKMYISNYKYVLFPNILSLPSPYLTYQRVYIPRKFLHVITEFFDIIYPGLHHCQLRVILMRVALLCRHAVDGESADDGVHQRFQELLPARAE